MKVFFDIALIITSILTVVCVVLTSRNAGMAGLTGGDAGQVFTARRGVEKILFNITIGCSGTLLVLVLLRILLF